MPIRGSAVLFTLYLVFRFVPTEYLHLALSGAHARPGRALRSASTPRSQPASCAPPVQHVRCPHAAFMSLMGAYSLARNVYRALVQRFPRLATVSVPFHLKLNRGEEG